MNSIKSLRAYPVQVKASFWFLICAFLQRGIQFITTPVFTRIMSTAEYGQFNVFNSWFGILTVIVSLNLFAGVYSRGVVKYEDDRAAFTSSMQGLSLTLTLLWSVVYFVFHGFWNRVFSLTTFQMICMFVMILYTNIFGFWSMSERVDYKYKSVVAVTIVMSFAQPVLGIIFVKAAFDKVSARIFGIAVVEAAVGVVLFIKQAVKGKRFFSGFYWKHALKFNVPLIPHYLSMTILNGSDRIMIGKMVSDSAAGIYGLAYSVSQVMTVFNTALMQTVEPWLLRKINEKRITDIRKIAYPTFLLVAAVNLLLIAFAPEAVKIFAPAEYYDAIWIIPPAAMSVFFTFSCNFFAVFELYYEKTKMIAFATATGAILNVALNFVFIRIFGYYAAGYTTLVCYMVYALSHMLFMRKICRERLNNERPFNLRIYFLIAVEFLAVGFLLMLAYPITGLRYALLLAAVVLCVIFRRKILAAVRGILGVRERA